MQKLKYTITYIVDPMYANMEEVMESMADYGDAEIQNVEVIEEKKEEN